MAKVRNVSGQALDVPRPFGYRLVEAGDVMDVADDELFGYSQQVGTWAPSGKESQAVHDRAEKAAEAAVVPEPVLDVANPVKES